MEKDLVSIIIPTYKRADRLVRAIKSCLNQTYENIEIIIIDDNGENLEFKEKNRLILEPFLKNEKIVYIEHSVNKGGAEARNTGIKAANGYFIAFLDDDDEMMPEKIYKQIEIYKKNTFENIGLVYCDCAVVGENGVIKGYYNSSLEGNPLYEQMLGCIAGTSLWFSTKEVLKDVGYFENTPSRQDTILLMKILANGYNIVKVPEPLVKYYETVDERISGMNLNNIEGEKRARQFSRKYYEKLESTKEILNVEYSFSKKLLNLYIINELNEMAKNELTNMLRINPYSLISIKGIFKFTFKKPYILFIKDKMKRKKTSD